MKKGLKITLFILLGFVTLLLIAYGYYGGFKKVTFEQTVAGGETLVFLEERGDYAKSGEAMNIVYQELIDKFGIHTTRGFGIYYDSPADVEVDLRRYDAGCIVNQPLDSLQIAEISKVFKVTDTAMGDVVVGEFPLKSEVSIFVGLMKAYPAAHKYFEAHNMIDRFGSVMEIYDHPEKKIIYRIMLLDPPADQDADGEVSE